MNNFIMMWERQPKAEKLIERIVESCCEENQFISNFQQELHKHSSTRLFDWLDHVIVGYSPAIEQELIDTGFISDAAATSYRVFFHPRAQLPRVLVRDHDKPIGGVAVKVESIADFLMAQGMSGWIEGSPFSPFRRCIAVTENDVSLQVVERRGTHSMEPIYLDANHLEKYLEATEKWQSRARNLKDEDQAMARTVALAEELVEMLGTDMAAWVVLECERKYWQARNTAGQIQKNRQDRLGMGWANHDHHTFRSSRQHFNQLVRIFEILGFHCRERFYAGAEAGWGAQVMENPRCGLVLFLDLDLSQEELEIDFAHHPLQNLKQLGTVGLWCALHGDSILKAGMHHLEAQFMFEDLKNDLQHLGVGMMDPFSNFDYLKQAFTHGEIWPVDPGRVNNLIERGFLKHEEADKFITYGAVGSHLENLQRREGYKGFNQQNVSVIIRKTDPRLV
jgi:hypothetical protein